MTLSNISSSQSNATMKRKIFIISWSCEAQFLHIMDHFSLYWIIMAQVWISLKLLNLKMLNITVITFFFLQNKAFSMCCSMCQSFLLAEKWNSKENKITWQRISKGEHVLRENWYFMRNQWKHFIKIRSLICYRDTVT